MSRKLLLGCDPELFLVDATGKLRASCGLIGGTKHAPMPLNALGDGYAVQEDNVAIEFNIPPAPSSKAFQESVTKTLHFLTNSVKGMYDFDISKLSAASFDKDELMSPAAREFGCDPDFNAWTGRRNPKPRAEDDTLRSCGGHIHIGNIEGVDKRRVIKFMDHFLGVPSVLMDEGELRKRLYGKRGAYREKPYGVEYRTLSNFWIFEDRLIDWAWRNTERAVEAAESQFVIDDIGDSIREAIDNNNKDAAKYLCKEFNLEVLNV